jgi:tetratricopeptide (TPR) repeat protein
MKKAIVILIILFLSLLYYMGVLTKKETLPFSKEFFLVESPESADRAWNLEKGASLDQKELNQLYQMKLDKGFENVPVLSFLLIRASEQARKKGDNDQAIQMATYSIKFSPDLSGPYFELARDLWHQNPFQLYKIPSEVFKGMTAEFQSYPSSVKVFFNTSYIFSNAVLMTFIIFGIVVMIKYLPLYTYDIRKNMAQEISGLLINSLKILVLFIPFFLRLDILWSLFFWSVLLWGYVSKREKQFILIFLIVLVYLPFFVRSFSSFLDGASSDLILEMNQINHEDGGRGAEEKLRTWLLTHPNDPEVLFSLGLAEKRQGHYPEAGEFYRRAIQQDPRFSEALSNLGNVYLAQKQTTLAIASYQQATGINPTRAAYYYNLYRAYSQESYLSEKINQTLQRAQELDPELISHYSMIDSSNLNRLVIDETLTPQRLWKRFLDQFIGREGFLFPLFRAWFEKTPSRVPFLTPVLFLGFLIAMARYCRAKRFLTRCPMCGSPTYRFYLGTSDQEFICFNCYRMFIQKEKLHPKIVEKKSFQVQQFQTQNHLISRFLSFFLVGFGYLWREQIFKGLLVLFIFFIFILRFVYWGGAIPSPFPRVSLTVCRWIFWGGFFLIFYIVFVRQIYGLKSRFETERKRSGYR